MTRSRRPARQQLTADASAPQPARPGPQQPTASDSARRPARRPAPPPLEANDQVVTAVITAGWAVALVVVLILREQIPPGQRWWIWTCLAGLIMGLFGLWYVPRLKLARARRARARRARAPDN